MGTSASSDRESAAALARQARAGRSRDTRQESETLTLPQPSVDAPSDEIQIPRGTMVFPTPLSQMPYERSRRDEHESELPCYIRHDAEANLACMQLPIYYRIEVFPPANNTECILIATRNRRMHGQGGDGITAYGSVNRTDFQFRTGVFGRLPRATRHCQGALLRQGEWNEMSMAISESRATYWINGQRIATVHFTNGDMPSTELFLGVMSYEHQFRVRRFDASRDPKVLCHICPEEEVRLAAPLKEKVITMHATSNDDIITIVCTSIAGEQVATIDQLSLATTVGDVRNQLGLGLSEFTIVQLLLPDGTLLQSSSDGVALSSILQRSTASDE